MPLSAHEQRILAGVEEELREKDPELADLFTRCPPPTARRGYPVSPAGLGLLVVVLLALVLVHPLAPAWGAAGVGLATAALVVPWIVVAPRVGAPQREPDRVDHDVGTETPSVTRTQRGDGTLGSRRAALPIGLTVWVLVIALIGSQVGLANAALITIALAMLVGVHLARWSARCALYRRFGPVAHPDHAHRED